ncbi:MAG: LptF/LptG family permease [Treponema sp.]|jgi:lipopolysaccharide export system permease protein|nr:LptF/LptG family permease [Treponema sp.]
MILDRYLVKSFLPIFFVILLLAMLLLSVGDLFANLWRYLNYEVSLGDILRVSLYYLPKCFSYALPVAILFAAAFTIGGLFARNELAAIFCAGLPFRRFCLPLIALGLGVSVFAFFFQDLLVVPTLRLKNELSRELLHQTRTESNSDIVIKAQGGELIYAVDYFDAARTVLNEISIIRQDGEGNFVSLIRAPRAAWTGEYWTLENALIYAWEGELLRVRPLENGGDGDFRESPDTFRRSAVNVEDLPVAEAALLVQDLKAAGLPYNGALADYYHRFSFSAASLVVLLLSLPLGGRFRKNIILMSLVVSVAVVVVFYVMEMISMMMAQLGYIQPLIGAWFPIVFFTILGMILLLGAKS